MIWLTIVTHIDNYDYKVKNNIWQRQSAQKIEEKVYKITKDLKEEYK